jgi:hypothetical protein
LNLQLLLNNGLRPFLSKWHLLLQNWEVQRSEEVSTQVHEKAWELDPELRKELETLRKNLEKYAQALANISGIED